MSRVEFVLIGTYAGLDEVADRLAVLLSAPDGNGYMFPLPGGGWAELDTDPVDPWQDDRFVPYRWQVAIGGHLDVDEQKAAARAVYETLARGTDWALGLTYDHLDALVAARSAPQARVTGI